MRIVRTITVNWPFSQYISTNDYEEPSSFEFPLKATYTLNLVPLPRRTAERRHFLSKDDRCTVTAYATIKPYVRCITGDLDWRNVGKAEVPCFETSVRCSVQKGNKTSQDFSDWFPKKVVKAAFVKEGIAFKETFAPSYFPQWHSLLS